MARKAKPQDQQVNIQQQGIVNPKEQHPTEQPTLRPLLNAFENAFSKANETFYSGALEAPVITIQQGAKARAYGWISVQKVWHEEKGGEYRELNISAEYLQRGFIDVATTLLHEMVHICNLMQGVQDTARSGIRHNQRFADTANAHGLVGYKGEDYDKAGWRARMTPQTAAWAEDNLQELRDALTLNRDVNAKKVKGSTKPLKYLCPTCGSSARATKPLNIRCMDCDEDMQLVDGE